MLQTFRWLLHAANNSWELNASNYQPLVLFFADAFRSYCCHIQCKRITGWFILFPQVCISAKHRTFAKERNHWMDFTGLGTMLNTTGKYLSVVFIYCELERNHRWHFWQWRHCYLRYLRFFPDGHVIMLTTPEEPLSVVPRLRTRNTRYTLSFL